MKIQWFPGHMTKALRMMDEQSKLVDCFIYVLDARAYISCINPTFDKIIGNKPVLYVLNKVDMIEESDAKIILNKFSSSGKKIVAVNSKVSGSTAPIIKALLELNQEKINRYKAKNVNKAIRAMVIGVPNTGKSNLINKLCGNKKTITGNRPGVTKWKQWVVIDKSLGLLDTPGTLCPSFDSETAGTYIAFIGGIRDAIIDTEQLARELTRVLFNEHQKDFLNRYNITFSGLCESDDDSQKILNEIAEKRGYILKGGEFDLERTYAMVIDDFRKNKIGKIALEL